MRKEKIIDEMKKTDHSNKNYQKKIKPNQQSWFLVPNDEKMC